MSLNRLILPSFFGAMVAIGGVGCGDDDGMVVDDPDAGDNDVDAPAGPSQTGRIIMAATTFFEFPENGEGILQVVDVQNVDDRVPFVYEEAPGSPLGCKVTEFTPEQLAAPPVNIGTLDFTIQNGPAFPTCNFVDGQGYVCLGAEGSGGDIAVANPNNTPPIMSLTNTNVTFGADQVGRHVRITGATNASNNGFFPVVGVMGDNTILFPNPKPGADAEADTTASYQVVAGFGPAGQTDPVPDDAIVTTELTAGGDGTFTDYTTNVDIGDSYTLDTATQGIIGDIPLDGSSFTLSCEGTGGDCGAAMATGIIIQTTDADVSMVPPFVLPPPVTKATRIFCLRPATGTVTIPAEASAFLMSSGATRIRALMVRANNGDTIQADGDLDNVAGHAFAGFTDVQ